MPQTSKRDDIWNPRKLQALPPGRHHIERLLYLQVSESGRRSWCIRYTSPVSRRQREMRLGPFAFSQKERGLTFSDAQERALALWINVLKHNRDPIVERDKDRAAEKNEAEEQRVLTKTFEEAIAAFIEAKSSGWKPSYADDWMQPLTKQAMPHLKSPLHNGWAIRLTRIMVAARVKKATAELVVASWSRARRRHRPNQAKDLSTTHRLGWTANPFWPGGLPTRVTATGEAWATRGPA